MLSPFLQNGFSFLRLFSTNIPNSNGKLSLSNFIQTVDFTLNKIYDQIDKKDLSIVDSIECENQVLTIELQKNRSYVINIQKNNLQIWFSSPFSGPKRFEYDTNKKEWFDIHNKNITLYKLLTDELNNELIKIGKGNEKINII